MLIIDYREPQRIINDLKTKISDVKIDNLSFGDYILIGTRGKVIIERKSAEDLIASIKDGRVWSQLKGVEKFSDYHRIIAVVGNIYAALKITHFNFVRYMGAKTSIIIGWDVSWVEFLRDSDFLLFIQSLEKKIGEEKEDKYIVPTMSKEGRTLDEEMMDMMTAVSGIGGKKSMELFNRYKSICDICSADKDELELVLGNKVGNHLYELIRHRFGGDIK